MTLTITHPKINNIVDWTQADLDAQIVLGNFPPGTLLSDIALAQDWNAQHTVTGSILVDGVTVTGNGITTPLVAVGDGTGDVHGPASSTDNALARFDSTTGKIIQNGIATEDDSGNITATSFIGPLTGNITGNVSGSSGSTTGNAATVTTNANLTGDVTSVGNATAIAAGVIVNADVNASAAISLTKLAATTASRALVSDGSGFITPATTTSTEIGFVNGVTSAIQTQINTKAPTASPTFTGTVTLPAGQVVNGVTLTTAGVTTKFLNEAGAYTTPAGGGTVTSVSGTSNRISSTGGNTPIIDIDAAYVGQSSITTLGTIGTATWQASLIDSTYGGTGVNNAGRTLTVGGNFTTSGAFATTLTVTGLTNVTLPTTGTLATLAGSEAFNNKTSIAFSATASPAYTAGKLVYDSDNESLTFFNNDSAVALQVGQEEWIRVKNVTGSTIGNGKAVYISGASAGLPTIALARANAGATTVGCGLTTESIANNATGYVTCIGVVHGLDTSAFAAGSIVFIDAAVAGSLTATAPTAPNYRYRVGIVAVSDASVGTIHVTPSTAALGNGTANQVFGINNAGTAQEVKSILGTASQVTITNTANTITASLPATINVNTSGSAATLTTTRAIYGNNFNGSAALTQVIASTFGGTGNGFAKFTGPTTSEKTFTLPDATATILTTNAAVTVAQGGSGRASTTAYAVICGGTTSTATEQSVASVGTAGQTLTSNGAGALPTFQTGPSSVLLAVGTASASSSIDFTTFNNTAYSSYIFVFDRLLNGGGEIWMRFSTDGGSTYQAANSSYSWSQRVTTQNTATPGDTLTGDSSTSTRQQIRLSNVSTGTTSGILNLYGAAATTNTLDCAIDFTSTNGAGGQNAWYVRGGKLSTGFIAGAVTAVRFLPNTSTFTSGSIRMYGVTAS